MAYGSVIRQGLRLAGKIDRKYNINKIFINKYFPPGYRKTANKIVDITGSLGGGYGLYRFVESLYASDSPGNYGVPQQRNGFTSRSPYKTRSRPSIGTGSRNKRDYSSSKRCRCPSHSKYFRMRNRFYR